MRMICLCAWLILIGPAASILAQPPAQPDVAAGTAQITPLHNGMDMRAGAMVMRVTALRDDILRVRIGPSGQLPEDASWAVLAPARAGDVGVMSTSGGFSTAKLKVTLDPVTMALTVCDLDGHVISADAAGSPIEVRGTRFTLRKQLAEGVRIFGLGDKTGGFDRRGHNFVLWNTDAYGFGEGTDPHYKAIPFFLAGSGAQDSYGILLDNSFRTSFDFGKQDADLLTMSAPAGPIDYYIIYGPHPRQVLEGYAYLTGAPPLPPRWALGFQQSRYSYMSAARVREVANTYRKLHIPADAIYMDIDYQDRNRPFTTNKISFPDFAGLMHDLGAIGFHGVPIVDLHIAAAPNQSYMPYDTGIAGDHFVRTEQGNRYVGKVWPGESVFPDFTRAVTRDWFGGLYKEFMAAGVSGIWNDMNEPAIFERADKTMPPEVVHRIDEPGFVRRVASHAEIHNVYGMENVRATFEGLRALLPDERPFVLTRASYAGGQRYAFTWTGDNLATWEHLRLGTTQLLNLGMSGFAFAGTDVGGYAGNPTPDLLTRWTEIAAFTPMFRYHAEKDSADKEVWVHGEPHTAIRRHFIEERYRLMPYIYTVAEETARTGVPMMRPLLLEFPELMRSGYNQPGDTGQSFMLGRALLVVTPDMGGSRSEYRYDVTLPNGGWYDFWTGLKLGTSTLKLTPGIGELPVFVRAGAIIPEQAVVQHEGEVPSGPLQLHVYPGPNCQGELYTDDGHSLAYQRGSSLRRRFSCTVGEGKVTVHISAEAGQYAPWWREIAVIVHDSAAPKAPLPAIQRYDAKTHTITAIVAEMRSAMDVVVAHE